MSLFTTCFFAFITMLSIIASLASMVPAPGYATDDVLAHVVGR